jgi:catechol 2,3-dioxygenase-like lactoylglutathione lyase family enzyme
MQSIDLSHLRQLRLPRLGQLGFIVRNIPASLPSFTELFDLDPWFEPRYSQRTFTAGGARVDLDFQITFAYSGKVQIELVQAPPGENLYRQHLERAGEGLHHLGFYLADLDRSLAAARQLGLLVLLEGRLKTAGASQARFAYLDTQELCGTIVELIEIKTLGASLPQTQFWMKISGLTGDVRRLSR